MFSENLIYENGICIWQAISLWAILLPKNQHVENHSLESKQALFSKPAKRSIFKYDLEMEKKNQKQSEQTMQRCISALKGDSP